MTFKSIATGPSIHNSDPVRYAFWHIIHLLVMGLPVFVTTLIGRDLTQPVILTIFVLFAVQKAAQLALENTTWADVLEDGIYLASGAVIGATWSGGLLLVACFLLMFGSVVRLRAYQPKVMDLDQL